MGMFWRLANKLALAGKALSRRRRSPFERLPRLEAAAIFGLLMPMLVLWYELALGLPTGMGGWVDWLFVSGFVLLALLATGSVSWICAWLFSWLFCWLPLRLRVPWLFLSCALLAPTALVKPLTYTNINAQGAILLTGGLAAAGAAAGVLGWLTGLLVVAASRRRVGGVATLLLVAVVVTAASNQQELQAVFRSESAAQADKDQQQELAADSVFQLQVEDPSEPGEYPVIQFTYGNGEDRWRSVYGDEATLLTEGVDASSFVTRWKTLRSWFWGFAPDALPLNGRVWLPEGEGPFPLVLIVHGNHTMEDYSDGGYAYLGELLASRGYITVSVDQNFVNYSAFTGIPNDDYELRAWLLLHHLRQFDEWNSEVGLLQGKIDMEAIALIGHSRGGQAAALATDFDRFVLDNEQPEKQTGFHYPIRTVIAIAPTDRRLSERYVPLSGVNYFVLHGSADADVTSFDGDRQYDRAQLIPRQRELVMKSSLYIENANHGQFNETWGTHDIKLPLRSLLDTSRLLAEEEQQQIAKVYISAFLDATIKGELRYVPLFKDWRSGASWLPDTRYLSRYADSRMFVVAHFDEDYNKETGTRREVALSAEELVEWEESLKRNRQQGSRMNRAVKLAWEHYRGSFALELTHATSRRLNFQSVLKFSVAVDPETMTTGEVPRFSIRLTGRDGRTASLPVDQFQSLQPLIRTTYLTAERLSPYIRGGRLKPSSELVFQDVFIPLQAYRDAVPGFLPHRLSTIAFEFDQTEAGTIWLDDIYLS